jgi:DNA-binding phage protein
LTVGAWECRQALSKDGNPTFDTVVKVMRAMGLRFEAKCDGRHPASD